MRATGMKPAISLAMAVVMSAAMWFYMQRVLIPQQVAFAATRGIPRGVLSDLFPRWLGARELLLHGRDPYSDQVTREIQVGYYGRPLDPNRPQDPKDQQRFAYPIYVVFVLWPFINLPFSEVRWISMITLATLTALSALLWMDALRWRLRPWAVVVCLLLVVNSVAVVQGIKLQQLTLLVGAMLAAAIALLARGRLFAAGILLALSTIKPQLAWLLAVWLFLWIISNWRERQNLFWGFAATLAAVLGVSEYVLPGWMSRFANAVVAYENYTGGAALTRQLETQIGHDLLLIVGVLGIAWLSWRQRKSHAVAISFQVTVALTLAVTVVLVSITAPYNQVLLLPAVFLIVKHWRTLWDRSLASRTFACLMAFFVLWPWIVSLGLWIASLILPSSSLLKAWAVPLWTSIWIPLSVLPLVYGLLPGEAHRDAGIGNRVPLEVGRRVMES